MGQLTAAAAAVAKQEHEGKRVQQENKRGCCSWDNPPAARQRGTVEGMRCQGQDGGSQQAQAYVPTP